MSPRLGEDHHFWKGDAAQEKTKREMAVRAFPNLGTCQDCESAPARHRHHIDGDTGHNERTNLAFLCPKCHMRAHHDLFEARAERMRIREPRFCPICKEHRHTHFVKGRCQRCYMHWWRSGREWSPQAPAEHCKYGHEFTPENTYMWGGQRHCRICNAERQRAYRERKKAAV